LTFKQISACRSENLTEYPQHKPLLHGSQQTMQQRFFFTVFFFFLAGAGY